MDFQEENQPQPRKNEVKEGAKLALVGYLCLALSFLLLLGIFSPLLWQEIRYRAELGKIPVVAIEGNGKELSEEDVLVPVNKDFSIVVPRIRANASIHKNTNWQDSSVYQSVLRDGVAHAAGTSTPDMPGNVFLFSHSGVDFYEAERYNAVFYLLPKLKKGDEMSLFYEGKEYRYLVNDSKTVSAQAVEYIENKSEKKTLTLMTCWPPGTTLKRYIVEAEQVTQ